MPLAVSAPVDWLPEVVFVPDQLCEAVQVVALVEDQVSVEDAPLATVVGFATSERVGEGDGDGEGAGEGEGAGDAVGELFPVESPPPPQAPIAEMSSDTRRRFLISVVGPQSTVGPYRAGRSRVKELVIYCSGHSVTHFCVLAKFSLENRRLRATLSPQHAACHGCCQLRANVTCIARTRQRAPVDQRRASLRADRLMRFRFQEWDAKK